MQSGLVGPEACIIGAGSSSKNRMQIVNTNDTVAPRPWAGHRQMSRHPKASVLLILGYIRPWSVRDGKWGIIEDAKIISRGANSLVWKAAVNHVSKPSVKEGDEQNKDRKDLMPVMFLVCVRHNAKHCINVFNLHNRHWDNDLIFQIRIKYREEI